MMIIILLGVPLGPLLYVCYGPLVMTNYQRLPVLLIYCPHFLEPHEKGGVGEHADDNASGATNAGFEDGTL